jgi:outer membrane protein OmpA-like peptidoglycan-associated protein
MNDIELKTTKIKLTGRASNTGSVELNTKIAKERADNAKKVLLEQFPSLDQNNLSIAIDLQPKDNTDDVSTRQ